MTREHYSFAQERCLRLTGKLMQRLDMLHPGARVGVAISGGVDSWVLLKVLALRRGIVPFPFEIMALHVNAGFEPDSHAPMADWLAEAGIAAHLEVSDHGPQGHSEANLSKSPCFYCARLRRKRLFSLCRDYKLTHLAFGHTAEDLVTTFYEHDPGWPRGRPGGQGRFFWRRAHGHPAPLAGGKAVDCQSGQRLGPARAQESLPVVGHFPAQRHRPGDRRAF